MFRIKILRRQCPIRQLRVGGAENILVFPEKRQVGDQLVFRCLTEHECDIKAAIFDGCRHFPAFYIAQLQLNPGTAFQKLANDMGCHMLMGAGAGGQSQQIPGLCLTELQDLLLQGVLMLHPFFCQGEECFTCRCQCDLALSFSSQDQGAANQLLQLVQILRNRGLGQIGILCNCGNTPVLYDRKKHFYAFGVEHNITLNKKITDIIKIEFAAVKPITA